MREKKELNETNECESYQNTLSQYLKSQNGRGTSRFFSQLIGAGSMNNNIDSENKAILDVAFQRCQLSKLNRIEKKLEELTNDHQIQQSNTPR